MTAHVWRPVCRSLGSTPRVRVIRVRHRPGVGMARLEGRGGTLRVLAVQLVAVVGVAVLPTTATAAARGSLVVETRGLPPGEGPGIVVAGPGRRIAVRSPKVVLRDLRTGRYVVVARPVRLKSAWRTAKRGADAHPGRTRQIVRVLRGRTARTTVRYRQIVNPGVQEAPAGLQAVVGDPANPSALLYRKGVRLPARGSVITAGPSSALPAGLVVRVISRQTRGARELLGVEPVPITAAIPAFDFNGDIRLEAAAAARTSVRARAAASCDGPKSFDLRAKLDQFAIRHASAKVWPPQMSFKVAIRTTESFAPKVAALSMSCDWEGGALGPWSGVIPTPAGIPIPVYATIPIGFSASVGGSISLFKLNVASTSVLGIDLGQRNHATFHQEGTNTWIEGAMQATASVKLATRLNLVLGIGNPNVGDFHVQAGYGPTLTWAAGSACTLDFAFGNLAAGARIGRFKATTPAWSPFSLNVWSGCQPPARSDGATPPVVTPTPPVVTPAPTPTVTPDPPTPPRTWAEQQGSRGANTFTNPYNASGIGVRIEPYAWVDVSCKVHAPQIASANPDGYWYRIASPPWNSQYYAVANTFWNGDVPGRKPYTHNTDFAVPDC